MRLAFATGTQGEFAYRGQLPWGKPIKEDMKHFSSFCRDKVLIMGYKTWLSMPPSTKEKYKMLVVFNRRDDTYDNFSGLRFVVDSPNQFIAFIEFLKECEEGLDNKTEYCLVGGAGFVDAALQNLDVFDRVLYTKVSSVKDRKFKYDRLINPSLLENPDVKYSNQTVSLYELDDYTVTCTEYGNDV